MLRDDETPSRPVYATARIANIALGSLSTGFGGSAEADRALGATSAPSPGETTPGLVRAGDDPFRIVDFLDSSTKIH